MVKATIRTVEKTTNPYLTMPATIDVANSKVDKTTEEVRISVR